MDQLHTTSPGVARPRPTQHEFQQSYPETGVIFELVDTILTCCALLLLAAATTSFSVLCSTKLILHLLQLLNRTAVECCDDGSVKDKHLKNNIALINFPYSMPQACTHAHTYKYTYVHTYTFKQEVISVPAA